MFLYFFIRYPEAHGHRKLLGLLFDVLSDGDVSLRRKRHQHMPAGFSHATSPTSKLGFAFTELGEPPRSTKPPMSGGIKNATVLIVLMPMSKSHGCKKLSLIHI